MTLLNETQKEQLLEISRYLRKTREEKSIRIEEVAVKTNIRLLFLKSLDSGYFEELPEPVYIQGFIRRYADILGLDGQAIANSFTVSSVPPKVVHSTNSAKKVKQEHPNLDKPERSTKSDTQPKFRIPLVVPYVLLLGVACASLIYVLNPRLITESLASKKNSSSNVTEQTTSSVNSTSTTETLANSSEKPPADTPSPPLPSNTENSPVKITLEMQGESWLQVKADGKTEFVGNLTKGERRTWVAQKQLTVRSGNAGAVLVGVDNQPAQPLGVQGEVKQVTYGLEQ